MRIRPFSPLLLTLTLAACSSNAPGGGAAGSTPGGESPPAPSAGTPDGGGASAEADGGAPPASDGGSSGSTWATELENGRAVFTNADGSGACGFDATPADLDVVGVNPTIYAASAMCGACMKITGPKGTVTARVTDRCADCLPDMLELSAEAFSKIADREQGSATITYQTVACNVSGPLTYFFDPGSSSVWTAIRVQNHRVPITKLEYKKAGVYVVLTREDGNTFVEPEGVGVTLSLEVRVTGADGTTIEDTIPFKSGQTVTGTKPL